VRHEIPHQLSPELLHKAVTKFAEVYCKRFAKYNAVADWVTDDKVEVTFKVKGIKLRGELELMADTLGIDMKVPFAFNLFKKKAVNAIEEEVQPWLDRAKNGEL
jgi:hypothetical protein